MKNKLIVFVILGIFIVGIFLVGFTINCFKENKSDIVEAYIIDNGFYESTNYETDNGYVQEVKIFRYKSLD